jgi:CBS domain-containing protein
MNIGSICKRPIVTIDVGESLQRAATLMREHHVGALVVIEPGKDGPGPRVMGVITDRDLAIEVLARGGDVAQVRVGRLARGHLASVPEEADLAEAVVRMHSHGVRRLLVSDAEGLLVGLLSFDDLLPACVAPLAGLADVLRAGLDREIAERGAIATPVRPALRVPAMGTVGWTTD